MRKLKSLLAVSLIATIVLLSGCVNIQSLLTKNDSDFYEISAYSDFADIYYSVDISGDNILFLTASGIEDYVISVYNVDKKGITAKKSLADCPLEYISGAKFGSSDQIIVYDDINEAAVTYDLNLNETGTTDYTYVNYYESAPESVFLNDTFMYDDTYAYSYVDDSCYFVFYDELDKVYVSEFKDEYIYSADDRKLFTVETKYSESGDVSDTTIYVEDIGNELCINSLKLEALSEGLSCNITLSAVSDKYVCFIKCVSNDITGAVISIPCLWKYTESPSNEALEVKSMTESDILEDNEKLISEIKSKYGINIFINKEPEVGFEVELNAALLPVNYILTQLSDCLELFPDNFLKEIYQYADGVKGIDIYIVDDIYGAGAFANDFLEYYEICFGCHSFGRSVVFHEFMHLIDNRIVYYYEDNNMDFRDAWYELNPPDFDYFDDEKDMDEEHFISYYAMTNTAEDLADTFQAMFEAYENGGDIRFTQFENVGKKAALLCEAIRKAYPSMANAEDVCWEKYAEFTD